MSKLCINRKGISRTAVALFLILVILIAVVAALYFGLLCPFFCPEEPEPTVLEAKNNLSVEERLEMLVANCPIENPLLPVYFHYLDRYFNGLSEDDIDLAVAGVMDDLSEGDKEAIADLLATYKNCSDILGPIIPLDYDLPFITTIDPSDLLTELYVTSLHTCAGTDEETPGQIRWLGPTVEELGPPVRVIYVNGHPESDEPPSIRPGECVTLQGYNFYNTAVTVRIEGTTYYTELSGEEVLVNGDMTTPVDAPRASPPVRDKIHFRLPGDIPPGSYQLKVYVPPPAEYPGWVEQYDQWWILVSPPSGEKYIIRALTIYCQDETNYPVTGEWGDDETFFSFFVYSGEKSWAVVTEEHDYNDGSSVNLEPDESVLYGPEEGLYTEVDGQLEILVSGYECEGADLEQARRLAKATTDLAVAIIVASAGGGGGGGVGQNGDGENGVDWASLGGVVNNLLDYIIGLFDSQVRVGDDRIIWTEDDLYFLTDQTLSLGGIESRRHDADSEHISMDGYEISMLTYQMPSGIEVRIPTYGDYRFPIVPEYSERSFTHWRGYRNHGDRSTYFILFEVQREG